MNNGGRRKSERPALEKIPTRDLIRSIHHDLEHKREEQERRLAAEKRRKNKR
jgi:hypothetical protein